MPSLVPESFHICNRDIVPRYLLENDDPWLLRLVGEYERFVGRPFYELQERLREPFVFKVPRSKFILAKTVLDQFFCSKSQKDKIARNLRSEIFALAKQKLIEISEKDRLQRGVFYEIKKTVFEEIAQKYQIEPEKVQEKLFSDLLEQKIIYLPEDPWTIQEIRHQGNFRLIKYLFQRANRLDIWMQGSVKTIVRQAKFRGLICLAERIEPETGHQRFSSKIEISGPLALLRHTAVYSERLAEIVPLLCRSCDFILVAEIIWQDMKKRLIIRANDPIKPNLKPREFDSKLEKKFFDEFQKAAPEWDILRETEPIVIGQGMFFPDFTLIHRHTKKKWLVEIMGFWTSDYLVKKIEYLGQVGGVNLIVCVDSNLNCQEQDFTEGVVVIKFKKKINIKDILEIIDK